jgi:hypothetical protein
MVKYAALAAFAAALVTGAGSALAASPPQTVVLPPRTFADLNPCTGATHLVTIAQTMRFHEFELEDPPRHHFNATFTGTVTTNDGFTGRIRSTEIDNGAGLVDEAEGQGVLTVAVVAVARNDSGDAFAVHQVLHMTVVDGEATAVVDRFRLQCLG